MRTLLQTYFAKPAKSFLLGLLPGMLPQQKRQSYILYRGKLRQQIMKLPDKPELPTAEFCCTLLREAPQLKLGEVYVTFRGAIKRPEDVQ